MLDKAAEPDNAQPRAHRQARWIGGLIALAGLLAAARAILLASQGALMISDDAYYYLVTARNAVQQGFYTFDGIHATNGFHPLWMFLVRIAVTLIGPGASDIAQTTALIATQALAYLACVGVCAFAVIRLLREEDARWSYFAGAGFVLVYPYSASIFFSGMETTLAAAFFLLLMLAAARRDARLFAVAAPLLFLSRLDTLLFVILPVGLYLFARRDRLREGIMATVPLVVTAGIYLALNQAAFGHPMPISGMLKSSFPRLHPNPSHLIDQVMLMRQTGESPFKLILMPVNLAFLSLATLFALARWGVAKKLTGPRALFAAIPLLLILNIVLFQKWNKHVEIWYLVLPALAAFGALGHGLATLPRAGRFFSGAVAGVIAISGLALGYSFVKEALTQTEAKSGTVGLGAPAWYDDKHLTALGVPRDAILAGTDVGTAAFRSHRRVINLDGLINDRAYQDVIRDGRLKEYLAENGVSYLITAATSGPLPWALRPPENMYRCGFNPDALEGRPYVLEYRVFSYLHGVYSDVVPLTPAMEVFRTPLIDQHGFRAVEMLFDIRSLGGDRAGAPNEATAPESGSSKSP